MTLADLFTQHQRKLKELADLEEQLKDKQAYNTQLRRHVIDLLFDEFLADADFFKSFSDGTSEPEFSGDFSLLRLKRIFDPGGSTGVYPQHHEYPERIWVETNEYQAFNFKAPPYMGGNYFVVRNKEGTITVASYHIKDILLATGSSLGESIDAIGPVKITYSRGFVDKANKQPYRSKVTTLSREELSATSTYPLQDVFESFYGGLNQVSAEILTLADAKIEHRNVEIRENDTQAKRLEERLQRLHKALR